MRTRSSKLPVSQTEQAASTNVTTSLILTLPDEVLRLIFCYLPDPIDTSQSWPKFASLEEPERLILHPVLVLRQVCRRFRATTSGLPFWYDDAFDPVSLISKFG